MNLRQSFKFLLCLIVAVCCQATYGQVTDRKTAEPQIRILSYNIHHGEGVDRKLDLERIAKVILSTKPDLVAVQEVDVKTSRTMKVDQAKKLADLTEMKYVFGANIEFGGGKYGNAVLSRYPIKSSKNIQLPNHRDGEQRGLLQVEIQHDTLKRTMQFWATHWDHRRNDSERVESAKRTNELLAKTKSDLVFMAGDFNDVVHSPSLKILSEKWIPSNSSPLATVPVKKPTRQIDFVWSAKRSKVNCIQTVVLPEAVASDHRAVLAVYIVK